MLTSLFELNVQFPFRGTTSETRQHTYWGAFQYQTSNTVPHPRLTSRWVQIDFEFGLKAGCFRLWPCLCNEAAVTTKMQDGQKYSWYETWRIRNILFFVKLNVHSHKKIFYNGTESGQLHTDTCHPQVPRFIMRGVLLHVPHLRSRCHGEAQGTLKHLHIVSKSS
jgi:hypothetical protein